MNNKDLARAISYLRPTAEFSISNGDYSTIKWDVLDGEAPTLAELEIAHKAVLKADQEAAAALLAKKEEAEAKLKALGLTLEDLKVLGLG